MSTGFFKTFISSHHDEINHHHNPDGSDTGDHDPFPQHLESDQIVTSSSNSSTPSYTSKFFGSISELSGRIVSSLDTHPEPDYESFWETSPRSSKMEKESPFTNSHPSLPHPMATATNNHTEIIIHENEFKETHDDDQLNDGVPPSCMDPVSQDPIVTTHTTNTSMETSSDHGDRSTPLLSHPETLIHNEELSSLTSKNDTIREEVGDPLVTEWESNVTKRMMNLERLIDQKHEWDSEEQRTEEQFCQDIRRTRKSCAILSAQLDILLKHYLGGIDSVVLDTIHAVIYRIEFTGYLKNMQERTQCITDENLRLTLRYLVQLSESRSFEESFNPEKRSREEHMQHCEDVRSLIQSILLHFSTCIHTMPSVDYYSELEQGWSDLQCVASSFQRDDQEERRVGDQLRANLEILEQERRTLLERNTHLDESHTHFRRETQKKLYQARDYIKTLREKNSNLSKTIHVLEKDHFESNLSQVNLEFKLQQSYNDYASLREKYTKLKSQHLTDEERNDFTMTHVQNLSFVSTTTTGTEECHSDHEDGDPDAYMDADGDSESPISESTPISLPGGSSSSSNGENPSTFSVPQRGAKTSQQKVPPDVAVMRKKIQTLENQISDLTHLNEKLSRNVHTLALENLAYQEGSKNYKLRFLSVTTEPSMMMMNGYRVGNK